MARKVSNVVATPAAKKAPTKKATKAVEPERHIRRTRAQIEAQVESATAEPVATEPKSLLKSVGFDVKHDEKRKQVKAFDVMKDIIRSFVREEGGEFLFDSGFGDHVVGARFRIEKEALYIYGCLNDKCAPVYQAARRFNFSLCTSVPSDTIDGAIKNLFKK